VKLATQLGRPCDMKIAARPLKGEPFDVEVEPTDTIEALKTKVTQQRPDISLASLKIVHNGRVLTATSTVQECGIKEGAFVVLMITRAAPAAAAASSAPNQAPAAANTSSASAAPAPAPSAPAPAPAPAAVGPSDAAPASYEAAAAALVTGPNMETTVQMLCAMGFSKSDVERCLQAAFNNPDRAVEYLMSGIPPGLATQVAAAGTPAPPAQGAHAPAPAAVPSAGSAAASSSAAASPFPMAGAGMGSANAPLATAASAATGPLAPLRRHPRFNQLRMVVQQSPQMLNQVLSSIHQSDPNLIQLIAEHQQEFVEMLQEPIPIPGVPGAAPPHDPVAAMLAAAQAAQAQGPAAAGSQAPAPQAPPAPQMPPQHPGLQLTPAEQQAVERLQALGFDRRAALEAYLACDKNENVAANYLFENMED